MRDGDCPSNEEKNMNEKIEDTRMTMMKKQFVYTCLIKNPEMVLADNLVEFTFKKVSQIKIYCYKKERRKLARLPCQQECKTIIPFWKPQVLLDQSNSVWSPAASFCPYGLALREHQSLWAFAGR